MSVGLAWIWVAAPLAAHAQLLDRASDAVHGGGDDGQNSSSSSDDDDDDDSGGGLLGSASDAAHGSSSGGYSGSGASGAPYVALGAASSIGCPFGQPYLDTVGSTGVAATDGTVDARLAVRLELEAGYVLGGAGRGGVGARLQLPFLLDLTTRYSVFFEPTEEGVLVAALGRIGGELRIVDNQWLQLRIGGGLRHFHDDLGSELGGDFTLGFDAFPGEPIVISGELSAGVVGQAIVVQARGRVGFIIDSTEIYAGYDYEALFAGGIQVDLGGPMLGVRAWL